MTQLNDIFFNASELGMVTGLNPNWPPKSLIHYDGIFRVL